MSYLSRRGFLAAAGVAAVGPGIPLARAEPETFDPTRNGFGFRNWASRQQELGATPPDPEEASILEIIQNEWADDPVDLPVAPGRWPDRLNAMISRQVHETIVQRAGTNGHCFGMVLAAQLYFENPAVIPVDRDRAADIRHVMEPLGEPEAPVYDQLIRLQAEQFLQLRSWVGRRGMLWADRLDTAAQLADIAAVKDHFGTAAITVFDTSRSGHQMLVYDYERRSDGVTLFVYDPNLAAPTYRNERRTVEFTRTEDGYEMEPYRRYTDLLFNRWDRIDDLEGRENATPLDHFLFGREELEERLFPMALLAAESATTRFSMMTPNGTGLGRLWGVYMERERGRFPHLRFQTGVPAGPYTINVLGDAGSEYAIRAFFGGPDGVQFDETLTGTIDPEASSAIRIDLPEDRGTAATIRSSTTPVWQDRRVLGAGAAGLALGVAGYHAATTRSK